MHSLPWKQQDRSPFGLSLCLLHQILGPSGPVFHTCNPHISSWFAGHMASRPGMFRKKTAQSAMCLEHRGFPKEYCALLFSLLGFVCLFAFFC